MANKYFSSLIVKFKLFIEKYCTTIAYNLKDRQLKRNLKREGVIIRDSVSIIGAESIQIGERTKICKSCIISARDSKYPRGIKLIIGNNCNIGEYAHITACRKILIGNNVLTGRWITITDNSHGDVSYEQLNLPPMEREIVSKGPVIIEDNVWLGDKVTVLPGVHIGRSSVIGANAVVTKDVPPFSIVVGNPGRIIKTIIE